MSSLQIIFGYPVIGVVLFGILTTWFIVKIITKKDSSVSDVIGEVAILLLCVIALVISATLTMKNN